MKTIARVLATLVIMGVPMAHAAGEVRLKSNDYIVIGQPKKNSDQLTAISILQKGRKIFSWNVSGAANAGEYIRLVQNTRDVLDDITGDGIPDLVLDHYTGGVNCCHTFEVYSLGQTFRPVATIEGQEAIFRWVDLDKDGKLEAVGSDPTFVFWNATLDKSPQPVVILSYRDGRYLPNSNLMRKAPPSEDEFQKRVTELKQVLLTGIPSVSIPDTDALVLQKGLQELATSSSEDIFSKLKRAEIKALGEAVTSNVRVTTIPDHRQFRLQSELWSYMLDLIYSGNGDLAWKALDQAWPADRLGRNERCGPITKYEFEQRFKLQLSTSPYWPELSVLNGWTGIPER